MILTIDFESYYSKTFSLSKMTTEEYIRSKSFEVIGVAVQSDDNDPVWYSGTKANTKKFLDQFDWANATAVAHNAAFDMAILNWHFDIRPKRIIDTLSMARAVHGTNVGGSLAALTQHYNLGAKGTEVDDALGKRRPVVVFRGREQFHGAVPITPPHLDGGIATGIVAQGGRRLDVGRLGQQLEGIGEKLGCIIRVENVRGAEGKHNPV